MIDEKNPNDEIPSFEDEEEIFSETEEMGSEPEDEEFDIEGLEELEEEPGLERSWEADEKAPSEEKAEDEEAPEEESTVPVVKEKKLFSPATLPMNIVVEVGRLQMSLQKLLELQPGNLLELNLRPESGVDLVVNGKRIAKGELLLIGDALGVRILDIG